MKISETEELASPFRPMQPDPRTGSPNLARFRRTTVYPSALTPNDGMRVHIFEWITPSPTGKYPPGSITIVRCEGRGPGYRKHDERWSPPGSDLHSAIEAAKQMLA